MSEIERPELAPVVKSLTVAQPVEHAFAMFTRGIGSWWPTDTHALDPAAVADVVFEERVGGRVLEVTTTGDQHVWATVLTWEPPHRLVLSWEVDPDRLGTEVEVRFTPTDGGAGTRVDLEHRGFDRLVDGAEMRARYEPGWDAVLAPFVRALPPPADEFDPEGDVRPTPVPEGA